MKYTIGEMSQLLGVTPHMLRYYEKVGIIRPETNNATGYRYYSVVDTRRFNLSRALFSSGISLERCSEILQGMPCWTKRSPSRSARSGAPKSPSSIWRASRRPTAPWTARWGRCASSTSPGSGG